jgi:sulfate/thiosulfate transport system ATP-binding protein
MSIHVRNITRKFGQFAALDNVSLDIHHGELVALLGPSGSGKTTLLRIIAGLDAPDEGSVVLDGEEATARPPQQRGVGFVFQHYALFRHMTVLQNVAFPLTVKPKHERPARDLIRKRAMELLSLVQLENYAGHHPNQLSGGQRQRIALARALAVEPRVLLLDEPFGALDAQVRKELRRWLRRLHDEVHVTSVFVTHDQEEALEVADRVVVFDRGHIEQVGTPDEVYHKPATAFVHRFLGDSNIFAGKNPDERVYVRPHDVVLSRSNGPNFPLAVTVKAVRSAGPVVRFELIHPGMDKPVEAEIPHERHTELKLAVGDAAYVGYERSHVYAAADGAGR